LAKQAEARGWKIKDSRERELSKVNYYPAFDIDLIELFDV
jgi:hypothetical protein